ncbi:MAG: pseudouridine synthase [Alistipes indistinctus]
MGDHRKPLQPGREPSWGIWCATARTNKSRIYPKPVPGGKARQLRTKLLGGSKNYFLVEVELLTGRHHQIRAQLSAAGSPIRAT